MSDNDIKTYLSDLFQTDINLSKPVQVIFKPGPFYSDGSPVIHMIGLAYKNGDEPANDYLIIMPVAYTDELTVGEWGDIQQIIDAPDGSAKLITTIMDGLKLHIVAYKTTSEDRGRQIYSVLNDTLNTGFEYDVLMHTDRGFGDFFNRTFPNALCSADWKPHYYLKDGTVPFDLPKSWKHQIEHPVLRDDQYTPQMPILYKVW